MLGSARGTVVVALAAKLALGGGAAASALALVAGGPIVLAQDRGTRGAVAPLARQSARLSPSDEALAGWFRRQRGALG